MIFMDQPPLLPGPDPQIFCSVQRIRVSHHPKSNTIKVKIIITATYMPL